MVPFKSREQLKEVPGFGEASFVQAAGFLKITDGEAPLDATWIHPESYTAARTVLERLETNETELAKKEATAILAEQVKTLDVPTLVQGTRSRRIVAGQYPDRVDAAGRDPREDLPPPIFKRGILKLEDLDVGMELTGSVLNVVDFGAFVDIGLHDSGLVHVSQLANKFVRDPHEIVSVGDIVKVWVLEIDKGRRRVSLTMIAPGTKRFEPQRGPRKDRGQRGPQGAGAPGAPQGAGQPGPKAKANAVRVLHAAIVRRVRAAIKADQIARAKAHPQVNKGQASKAQDNKVNPLDNNNAAAVNVMAASAAVIAAHVRQRRVPRACSALRLNSSARNLAAARNRLDVPAAAVVVAVVLRVAKEAPAAIKARAAGAADAAGNRADAAMNRANSWPRPSRSRSCRSRDKMKTGKEPLRTFGDLLQFMKPAVEETPATTAPPEKKPAPEQAAKQQADATTAPAKEAAPEPTAADKPDSSSESAS